MRLSALSSALPLPYWELCCTVTTLASFYVLFMMPNRRRWTLHMVRDIFECVLRATATIWTRGCSGRRTQLKSVKLLHVSLQPHGYPGKLTA